MKRLILVLLLAISLNVVTFCQKDSIKQDSITVIDIQKHVYLTSIDWTEYLVPCFNDSVALVEFNKPIDGIWWKTKGRYYWNPFDQLPQGVKYLHRTPTWEGYIEFMQLKYSNK
jgi:hypothetical protein